MKACAAELSEYESEVINVIRGISKLSSELLNKLHAEAEQKTVEAKNNVIKCEEELQNSKNLLNGLKKEYDDLVTWSEIFANSEIDVKKMIASHIIKTVKVSRNYELEIDLNISCEQFDLTIEQVCQIEGEKEGSTSAGRN